MKPMQVFFVCASLIVLLSDRAASSSSEEDEKADLAAQAELKSFLGVTYRLAKSDGNLDNVLAELGYSPKEIKEAAKKKPTLTLDYKGAMYTLDRVGGGIGDFAYWFPLATKTPPLLRMKFFNSNSYLKMVQEKNVIRQLNKKGVEKCKYEFTKDEVKVTINSGKQTTVQTFTKEG